MAMVRVTGTLAGAVVTVGDGFTMTAAAAKVTSETVNKAGTGALSGHPRYR